VLLPPASHGTLAEAAPAEPEPEAPAAGETTELVFDADASGNPAPAAPTVAARVEGFFGLEGRPFGPAADPDCFFRSKQHWEALCLFAQWLRAGRPVAVLDGEPGCGKSLLLACLARQLSYRRPMPVVMRPGMEHATLDDLVMATIARAAELHGELPAAGQSPLEVWHAAAAELRRRNVLVAFLIDDADAPPLAYIAGFASLLKTPSAREATRILLAGRHRVRELVANSPLSQHLGAECRLSPLQASEVRPYVAHRLRAAAAKRDPLFTRDALQLIATYSNGVPRLINMAADAAMFCAFQASQRQVTADLVARAIREAFGADMPNP
jgi:general secretion pathway protein A